MNYRKKKELLALLGQYKRSSGRLNEARVKAGKNIISKLKLGDEIIDDDGNIIYAKNNDVLKSIALNQGMAHIRKDGYIQIEKLSFYGKKEVTILLSMRQFKEIYKNI